MNHRIFKPLLREAASEPQLTSGSRWKARLFPPLCTPTPSSPTPSSQPSVTECNPLPAERMARNVCHGLHEDRTLVLSRCREGARAGHVDVSCVSTGGATVIYSHRLTAALRLLPAE
jgi:hypothetical protein